MFKRMFAKSIAGLLALMLVLALYPFPVHAETSQDQTSQVLEYKKLDVSVMPEYDDPRVLVIYDGILVNKSNKPATGKVSFDIPKIKNPSDIGMACEIVNGNHNCQPWQKEAKGDYDRLYWKLSKTLQPGEEYEVYLEFYYTPGKGYSAPDKSFEYDVFPTLTTEQLNLIVTQPLKATNFQLIPSAPQSSQNGEGMNTFLLSYADKQIGEKVPVKISYTKTDPKPSKEKATEGNNAQAEGGSATPTFGGLAQPQVLIPVLVFILALAVLIVYVLTRPKTASQPGPKGNGSKSTVVKPNNSPKGKAQVNNTFAKERQKARQMLLSGRISEETYLEILAEIGEEDK